MFDICEAENADCSAPPRNDSKHSQMSGASDLEKFNENDAKFRKDKGVIQNYMQKEKEEAEKRRIEDEKIDKLFENNPNLPHFNNEWDAIDFIQKKTNKKELLNEKIKDKEVKNRTRQDLDEIVKRKIIKEHLAKIKEREYDVELEKNLKKMDEMERQKQQKIKRNQKTFFQVRR